MADNVMRGTRVAGQLTRYGPALGLATCFAAYIVLGQVLGSRLLQGICALAAGVAVWQARGLAAAYRRLWRIMLAGARRRHQALPLVAVTLLFCALTSWGLLNNLITPLYGVSKYNYLAVVAGAAALVVLLPAVWGAAAAAAKFLSSRNVLRLGLLVLFFAAFFALQVRIGYAVRLPPGWDAQAVLDSAAGLATGSMASLDPWYFANFSNNVTLTLALAEYFKLAMLFGATDLMLAGVVLNCIVLTLGAILTYVVARRVGNEAVALFTLLPSAVFLLLSPWIMVAYSDTLGLLFPILLFYLYLAQARAESRIIRSLLQAGMGLTAAVGYNIKPTIIIVLLAIAAVAMLGLLAKRPAKRQLLAAMAGTAIVVGGYAAGSSILTAALNASEAVTFDLQNNPLTFPAAHYLNMGAQARDGSFNSLYGAWNGPDLEATASMPPDERTDRNLASYLDRVQTMGIPGYLSFLSSKLIWFLGDGSFFLWGEGAAASHAFVAEDALSQDIQSYYGFTGDNYAVLIGVWQTAWFVLLGLLCLPLFSTKPGLFSRSATILRIALLGLFVFLLLFEARSRYLYLYLPFFIVLASLSASAFSPRRTGSAATTSVTKKTGEPSSGGPSSGPPAPQAAGPAVPSESQSPVQPPVVGSVGSPAPPGESIGPAVPGHRTATGIASRKVNRVSLPYRRGAPGVSNGTT